MATLPDSEAVGESVGPSLTVRPARIGDMHQVEFLIRRFASKNVMLPRSLEDLMRSFREFTVAVDEDGRVAGCAALRVYNEDLAEVCSLAVDDSLQGRGIGRRLVEQVVENAQHLRIARVFALTLTPAFFGRLGFQVVPRDDFPQKVWADCLKCPKLNACDEIAVAIPLSESVA